MYLDTSLPCHGRFPGRGTVGSHFPCTSIASPSPGQGGIVTPSAASASSPKERNWKWVPNGIVRQTPEAMATISSCPSCFRHISPRPERKNHISSTVRWVTAVDVCPGGSSKCAMLPPLRANKTRTFRAVQSDGVVLHGQPLRAEICHGSSAHCVSCCPGLRCPGGRRIPTTYHTPQICTNMTPRRGLRSSLRTCPPALVYFLA